MEEEIGKEGPIRSIFLAEFHPDIGPIISYQYPEGAVTKEIFDAVNVYIIPKAHIQKQVITVNVLGHKITGYPNEIKNQKYARNALIFNLCFVCGASSRTVQYEPVVKKLSEYLENLELENQFLSSDDTRCQLLGILKKILQDLNAKGSCTLSIRLRDRSINEGKDRRATMHDVGDRKYSLVSDRRQIENDRKGIHGRRMSMVCDRKKVEPVVKPSSKSLDEEFEQRQNSIDGESKEKHTSILHLKVVRVYRDPARVYDYHVPILVSERVLQRTDLWDLTTQQILSYIDGYSHVAKIAAAADVENNLVKLCVQNLLYYGVVQLLPIFQYSNSYTVTGEISRLYKDRALQEECQRAVCKNEASPTYLSNIIKLYCSSSWMKVHPCPLGRRQCSKTQQGLRAEAYPDS
ncbi:nitrogen permease regulator-like 2 isoform X2 [Oratosquilla oratoria]|uniref:nitrogen permease regulator-like 2 isoform X2 n=1 Tax=Oratosquilla oratoria TaxID=337810 RepID=UPI003F773FFF